MYHLLDDTLILANYQCIFYNKIFSQLLLLDITNLRFQTRTLAKD